MSIEEKGVRHSRRLKGLAVMMMMESAHAVRGNSRRYENLLVVEMSRFL